MRKIFVALSSALFLLFCFYPFVASGQEISPTPEITITPTETPSVSPTESVSTPTPEILPSYTPSPLPTPEFTPIPTTPVIPEITPSLDSTPTPTPEVSVSPANHIYTNKTPAPAGIGIVEGYGQKFEITDSSYLNLVTESSDEVYMRMESIPEMVVIKIRGKDNLAKTRLRIFGWEAETTYHKYTDNYHNHEEIHTDGERIMDFEVNLDPEETKLVYIQPRPSTKYIKDDATGGNCTTIGTWNLGTKTCTLTMDLTETVQIDNNNITFDGNGRTITGSNSGYGVNIPQNISGVTIKNLTVKKFSYGININYQSSNNTIINNTVSQNTTYGIFVSSNSNNNNISNNTVSDNYYGTNSSFGIYIYDSENNTLNGNTISGSKYNFFLYGSTDARFNHNISTTNTVDGKAIYYLKNASSQTFDSSTSPSIGIFYCISCSNVVVKNLTLSKNGYGVFLHKPASVTVQNINSSNSYYGVSVNYATVGTTVIKDNSVTGNYYGIQVANSNNVEVRSNVVSNSYEYGIGLIYNNNNTLLANNTVSNSSNYGLRIEGSQFTNLTGNQITSGSGSYTFWLGDCYSDAYCDFTVDNTNLLNGKILYYFKNQTGQTYDNITNPGMIFVYKGSNVTVKNMTMDGVKTTAAVYFFKTNNSRIENIRVNNNSYTSGIQLYSSNYNTVTGNTISNTYNESLYMRYSSYNTVFGNTITGSGNRGYSIGYTSNNNQFTNNTVSGIYNGFYVSNSSYNTFTGNTANNNNYGFDHSNATYNTWDGNTAQNNQQGGFDLYRSSNNILRNNVSSKNRYGVEIYYQASNNEIYDNTFSENAGYDYTGAGVLIRPYSGTNNCNNNKIYRNNFINNATQAKIELNSGSGNVFYLPVPTGGNYWSDWTGPDANGDGFIDVPYNFSGGSDVLPRVCPGGSFQIDKAAPTTTVSLAGDSGVNGWYRSNVTVSLNASDVGSCGAPASGVAKTEYSYDKVNWTNYTAPFSVVNEGIKTLYTRSIDNSGNIESTGATELINLINDSFTQANGPALGWTVQNGSWNVESNEYSATGTSGWPYDAVSMKGDLSWKNYTVQAKFNAKNTSNWQTRLFARYNGNFSSKTGYILTIHPTGWYVNRAINNAYYGSWCSGSQTLSSNAWHTLSIDLQGQILKFYLNGALVCTVTDASIASGKVMLNTSISNPSQHGHFDDVVLSSVQPIPPSTEIKIDQTNPVINALFAGTMGVNDWYATDVTATLTVSDNNAIDKTEYSFDNTNWNKYTSPVTLSSSGEFTFYYRTFDSAGNLAAGQQIIKIDKTPPTTSAVPSGTMGNNNWYVSDVAVTLSATDDEGGMEAGNTQYSLDGISWQNYLGQFTLNQEGTTTIRYRSTDSAGNRETAKTEVIKIDKTAPNITGSRTPDANAYNWNKENVTVSFECNDTGSGIASCTSPTIVSSEGVSQFIDGEATDQAGNTANYSVTGINIDKTPPQVTNVTKPEANKNGWYKNDVTISFACVDDLSGPVNSNGSQILTTEGEDQSVDLKCVDLAGNTIQMTQTGINIDKTKPDISILNPVNGDYLLNQLVLADWTAIDNLSQIETITATKPNGQPINTALAGLNSFKVEASDYAGNVNYVIVNYNVRYKFGGILQPINSSGNSVFRLKSTIPVKFKLFDQNNVPITNAIAYLNLAKLSGSVLGNEIEAISTSQATEGNLFRFDPAENQYLFNLNTKTMSTGTWMLKIYLNDGDVKEIQVSLR